MTNQINDSDDPAVVLLENIYMNYIEQYKTIVKRELTDNELCCLNWQAYQTRSSFHFMNDNIEQFMIMNEL